MIFEGPLIFSPSLNIKHLFLDLDDGNIHAAVPASPRRADHWVRANVHVPERPDWVFVKLFAHGISTADDEEAAVPADLNAGTVFHSFGPGFFDPSLSTGLLMDGRCTIRRRKAGGL